MTDHEDRLDTNTRETSRRASTRSGHEHEGDRANKTPADVMGGPDQSSGSDEVMGGPNEPPPGEDVMAPHGGDEQAQP